VFTSNGQRDHSNISTCISKAVDNEFSGNMIDVCPVGALTDKHLDLNLEYGSASLTMHTEIAQLVLEKPQFDGDEIQRVTGRKDEYHEVDEFICNGRFDHKDIAD
jgi:NADH-quinone oxidoreductase subunit G